MIYNKREKSSTLFEVDSKFVLKIDFIYIKNNRSTKRYVKFLFRDHKTGI